MKQKVIQILAAITALSAVVAGLELQGITSILPDGVAKPLAVIPSAAAVIYHGAKALSEKVNELFPILVFSLVAVGLSAGLVSCSGWSVDSPYGRVETDEEGNMIYYPPHAPIVIPRESRLIDAAK